jgi:hypothetical protein
MEEKMQHETELSPEILLYYLDPKTGQAYVEVSGRTFELIVGDDVTDELHIIGELEPIAVHDPRDADEEPDSLRIESLVDDIEEE